MQSFVNDVTSSLEVYPMERLFQIKQSLLEEGKEVYDFGIGDPKLPLWPPVIEAVKESIESTIGYPSIRGVPELYEAQKNYLERRFQLSLDKQKIALVPTRGSKEAIFHIALSLVGRAGKKTIAYPCPGYPVYASSTKFSGGTAYPIYVNDSTDYHIEPWNFPKEVIADLSALWVNYPHNPTGTSPKAEYWQKLIDWCQKHDVILLSDECYSDLYDQEYESEALKNKRPLTPLSYSSDRVLSFYSLSKRSGFTGLRAGFIAGDSNILTPHLKARANFGLASPLCIQKGAALAWQDDEHVKARRKILSDRMQLAFETLNPLGMLDKKSKIPFYIWAKIPPHVKKDDISFCLDLAKKGVIATPAQWLGSKETNYLRFSLTQEEDKMKKALAILKTFL